jgi:hypothetical protein
MGILASRTLERDMLESYLHAECQNEKLGKARDPILRIQTAKLGSRHM